MCKGTDSGGVSWHSQTRDIYPFTEESAFDGHSTKYLCSQRISMYGSCVLQNVQLYAYRYMYILSLADTVWLKFLNYDLKGNDIGCKYYAYDATESISDVCFSDCLKDPTCLGIVDVLFDNTRCCPKFTNRWQVAPTKVSTEIHHYEYYSGSHGMCS